jgi:hypothetical protein
MASDATDMRCGFDRLAERLKTVIGQNPQSERNTVLSKTPIRIAHAGRGTHADSPHAALEPLEELPERESFHQADKLMEGAVRTLPGS